MIGVIAWFAACPITWAQAAPADGTQIIELTQVDVSSTKDWTSRDISVIGIRLGMRRESVQELVRKQGFQFTTTNARIVRQSAVPCVSMFLKCHVDYPDGRWAGMEIEFNNRGQVAALSLDSVVYGARSVLMGVVARRLKGNTFQLFYSYSDALRKKLLGPETEREYFDGTLGDKRKDIRYHYAKRGLIFEVSATRIDSDQYDLIRLYLVPPRSE